MTRSVPALPGPSRPPSLLACGWQRSAAQGGIATVISKGLHRYETFNQDAKGCQPCQQILMEMKQADERLLERIVGHVRQHLDKGKDAKAA